MDIYGHRFIRQSAAHPDWPACRRRLTVRSPVSHSDIAVALLGEARVDRDWHHPHSYLRNPVRPAILYGRELMEGGYRRLLS